MAHTHSVEDRNVYYIEQLCTIGFCGALGIVQILLYHYKVLEIILTSKFHIWVLLSGIVLTTCPLLVTVITWLATSAVLTWALPTVKLIVWLAAAQTPLCCLAEVGGERGGFRIHRRTRFR